MTVFMKRLFDIIFSVVALVFLAPLFILIAILIKIGSPGGVFYRGIRVGRNGKLFRIFKFRTMVVDAEQKGGYSTSYNDHRLTSIGSFLRRYKIDELPQFINVFLGQMSIVGPRPQVKFYTDKYGPKELPILSVKPGITDFASLKFYNLAQTLGEGKDVDDKYSLEVEPIKNELRLEYVRKQGFKTDMTIITKTVARILTEIAIAFRDGIKRESAKWNIKK